MRALAQGANEEAEWNELYAQYKTKYPEEAEEFEVILSGDLPEGWENALPTYTPADKVRTARSQEKSRCCHRFFTKIHHEA